MSNTKVRGDVECRCVRYQISSDHKGENTHRSVLARNPAAGGQQLRPQKNALDALDAKGLAVILRKRAARRTFCA